MQKWWDGFLNRQKVEEEKKKERDKEEEKGEKIVLCLQFCQSFFIATPFTSTQFTNLVYLIINEKNAQQIGGRRH